MLHQTSAGSWPVVRVLGAALWGKHESSDVDAGSVRVRVRARARSSINMTDDHARWWVVGGGWDMAAGLISRHGSSCRPSRGQSPVICSGTGPQGNGAEDGGALRSGIRSWLFMWPGECGSSGENGGAACGDRPCSETEAAIQGPACSPPRKVGGPGIWHWVKTFFFLLEFAGFGCTRGLAKPAWYACGYF
ncbi:hypothetical protein B0T22DRAFT_195796 [Podospora appendiculata]|uniref:Uncharacterized protein n=1 Tax=Podospora appendiculata TaxID=314037 RepID=A0AAE1C6V7_9PEZI|nr:hypothetical protein B0T22DRAFT_195796 [Podospora appendiculata]